MQIVALGIYAFNPSYFTYWIDTYGGYTVHPIGKTLHCTAELTEKCQSSIFLPLKSDKYSEIRGKITSMVGLLGRQGVADKT